MIKNNLIAHRAITLLRIASLLAVGAGATATETDFDALLNDLRDDTIPRNATHATAVLNAAESDAVKPLESVLDSDDRQQRRLAMEVLCRIEGYEPGQAWFQAAVEGLAFVEPALREDRGWALAGIEEQRLRPIIRMLLIHADAAEEHLAAGLRRGDHQRRFLCAFILGHAGVGDANQIVPILLPHLRSNHMEGDALMAAAAIYGTGIEAKPLLEAAREKADKQQAKLIWLILLDLEDPPITDEQLQARGEIFKHRPRTGMTDPVSQFDLDLWHFRWGRAMKSRPS